MPSVLSGCTNNSIRSGSGMEENVAHLFLEALLRPIRVLAVEEGRFMSAHRPVKSVRGLPALLGRHAPEDFDLLRTGLFVGQHIKIRYPEGGLLAKVLEGDEVP